MERAGPIITSTKSGIAALHHEPAWAIARPPLVALSPSEQTALVSQLRELKLAGL